MANLSVAAFGPKVTIVNAFLFIGLDLTARDKLHDNWKNDRLFLKMALLIFSGSVISFLLNHDAGTIAVASFVAFAAAASIDSLVYHKLENKPQWLRINGSNVPSAAVDSLLFPVLAFGFPVLWGIVSGQFIAKVLGGFLWSLIFKYLPVKTVRNIT